MGVQTVIDSMTSRLKHPFLGSFTVAFIAYNWKCLFWAFAGSVDDPQLRISKIAESLGEHSYLAFLVPLLEATLFVVLYPLLAAEVEKWNHRVRTWRDNSFDQITATNREPARTALLRSMSSLNKIESELNSMYSHLLNAGKLTEKAPKERITKILTDLNNTKSLINSVFPEKSEFLRSKKK